MADLRCLVRSCGGFRTTKRLRRSTAATCVSPTRPLLRARGRPGAMALDRSIFIRLNKPLMLEQPRSSPQPAKMALDDTVRNIRAHLLSPMYHNEVQDMYSGLSKKNVSSASCPGKTEGRCVVLGQELVTEQASAHTRRRRRRCLEISKTCGSRRWTENGSGRRPGTFRRGRSRRVVAGRPRRDPGLTVCMTSWLSGIRPMRPRPLAGARDPVRGRGAPRGQGVQQPAACHQGVRRLRRAGPTRVDCVSACEGRRIIEMLSPCLCPPRKPPQIKRKVAFFGWNVIFPIILIAVLGEYGPWIPDKGEVSRPPCREWSSGPVTPPTGSPRPRSCHRVDPANVRYPDATAERAPHGPHARGFQVRFAASGRTPVAAVPQHPFTGCRHRPFLNPRLSISDMLPMVSYLTLLDRLFMLYALPPREMSIRCIAVCLQCVAHRSDACSS